MVTDMREYKIAVKPKLGETVLAMTENNEFVTATYDNSGFYRLELDDTVGCLRKMPVKVKAWTQLYIQNFDS